MLNRRTCVFVLIFTACARSTQRSPDPVLEPASNSPATPAITTARSWTLIPTTAIQRYISTATTTLELQSDTATTRGSVTTTAAFTLSAIREAGLARIQGSLDSFSTKVNGRITQPDQASVVPLIFRGRLVNGGFNLDSINGQPPGTGDCRNQGLNSLSFLRQSVVAVPSVLTAGLTWVDSSTISACNGSIPLQLTAVKTYTVAGEDRRNGSPVIVIDRVDTFAAFGEGAQSQHRVTIIVRGSGSAKVYVDRASGMLNSSEGELQARVTINASGRTQIFNQTVKERTVLTF